MRKRSTLLEPLPPGTRIKVAWCGHTVCIVRLIDLFITQLQEILHTYTVQYLHCAIPTLCNTYTVQYPSDPEE